MKKIKSRYVATIEVNSTVDASVKNLPVWEVDKKIHEKLTPFLEKIIGEHIGDERAVKITEQYIDVYEIEEAENDA